MFQYLLLICLIASVYTDDRPIVKIKNGLIRGTYKTSRNGRQFAAFEGVPYAKPPVADLRFKQSEPKEPWTGIWEASTTYICMQMDHNVNNPQVPTGTEDCLYVNVYTPKLNDEKPTMDVIVHFHSGAFMWGAGVFWGPEILMDHDVVYVNLNYRLGPLGFLSTEDDVVPGNNGLKDQNLALKWVKENIEHFGGNPESITITGLSAGGASVHYHILSPLSKGLYNRGISVSGNALCNWALVENPLKKTRQLGLLLGCGQQSTKDLVDCLRQRSPKQIVAAVKQFQPWLYNPYSPFGPVVEGRKPNSFLPDLPYNLLKKGQVNDVPWITSVTSEEGLYPAAEFAYDEKYLPYLEKNWDKLAAYILHYDGTAPEESFKDIAQKIKDKYLHGKPISKETFPELVQVVGDRLFVVDAEKAARLQANVNKSPVYFYRFTYRGDHSLSEYYSGHQDDFGVAHTDDLIYIIQPDKSWVAKHLESKADKKMSDILVNMWLSYIKTGEPKIQGVKWPQVSKNISDKFKFLNMISPDKIIAEEADELGYRSFWDSLPIKENNLIVSTKDEL